MFTVLMQERSNRIVESFAIFDLASLARLYFKQEGSESKGAKEAAAGKDDGDGE